MSLTQAELQELQQLRAEKAAREKAAAFAGKGVSIGKKSRGLVLDIRDGWPITLYLADYIKLRDLIKSGVVDQFVEAHRDQIAVTAPPKA